MREHPIENLMSAAMNSIKDMVDVNTIVGNPIKTDTGICIIPVSKVCFGFAAGGTEFYPKSDPKSKEDREVIEYPFGGGSGAAVKINPIGFIIADSNLENVPKFIPVEHSDAIDKLLDYVPDLMEKVNKMFDKVLENKSETIIKEKTEIQEEQINPDKSNDDYFEDE